MFRRQSWIASTLVFLGIAGSLVGRADIAAAATAGKQLYQDKCQSCHGADGSGNPQLEQILKVTIPPVTAAALQSKDDAEMLRIIAEGQGKMPGYADELTSEEQQQVLEYMKTLGQE